MSKPQLPHKSKLTSNSYGQVAVEYLLLFTLAISIGLLITNQLVRRDPNNPGALIAKWQKILQFIATDDPNQH